MQNNSLNESQIKAINTYDRHLLILAGAGTGKTLTITSRIANLVLNNICTSDRILAVTFTNKAAGEMKARMEKLVGDDTNMMWIGTFHSISARILRMYAKALNLEPNFLILDEYDKKKLLTSVIKDLNIDEKRFPIKVCQFIISSLKEKCISPDDEEKISNFKYRDLDVLKLYQTYQFRLRGMNAVDFDDLIFECVRLFKKEPKILSDLQNRFNYITVDEYQDTNELQHLWLCLLAGSNNNVCCVGDEDQSIYGWRGAKVDYILNFERDFLGAKIIRLEQNYRSVQPILKAAMSVISNNQQRYNKTLTSTMSSNDMPYLFIVESDKDENINIIKNISFLHNNGSSYKDMAILVRATHQMRSIEDIFIKNNIPYKIIGGIKFYERKEIKDIIAYLRWCYSLTDIISLDRIINVPKRGIGEKTFKDIIDYVQNNNLSFIEGFNRIISFGGIIGNKNQPSFRKFVEFTENIHDVIIDKKLQISDIIEKIYFNSGYAEMLQAEMEQDAETASKIENIKELISSTKQFNTIDEFLEHISLVSATDDENYTDSVNIMTMHASKGLEFMYVFLPAWEEGVFPSQKSIDENGNQGIEEERRLAYVALTRARKNFYVYTAKQRMIFGRLQLCQSSRFIHEMINDLKQVDLTYKVNGKYNNVGQNSASWKNYRSNGIQNSNNNTYYNDNAFSNDLDYNNNLVAKKAMRELAYGVSCKKNTSYNNYDCNSFQNKIQSEFKVGDKVIHEKFGLGVVKFVYGNFYEVQFKECKQITKDIKKAD